MEDYEQGFPFASVTSLCVSAWQMVSSLFFSQDSPVLKGQKLVAGASGFARSPLGKGPDL